MILSILTIFPYHLPPFHPSIVARPTQMIAFFKLKQKHSHLYEDLYPNNVAHVFEQELVRLVPTRDDNGSRVLLIECGSKFCDICWVQQAQFMIICYFVIYGIIAHIFMDIFVQFSSLFKNNYNNNNVILGAHANCHYRIDRKMETIKMLVERFVPCHSSHNSRIDARANNANLRRLRRYGLWRSVVESHHAIYTIICFACSSMDSSNVSCNIAVFNSTRFLTLFCCCCEISCLFICIRRYPFCVCVCVCNGYFLNGLFVLFLFILI